MTMEKTIRHIPAALDQIAAKMAGVSMQREIKVVSLFSGCGGMDLGFMGGFPFNGKIYDKLPFKIVWANDISQAACDTYKRNLKHKIRVGDLDAVFKTLPKKADVVIGGFPCQDVSINGIHQGGEGVRTNLYKSMIEVIKRVRPKVFVAENVKGLLLSHSKDFFASMLGDFEALKDYTVSHQLYMAADFGVPQTRERLFIVGVKGKQAFEPPIPAISETAKWVTCGDVLSDLENKPEDTDTSHIWSRAAKSPGQGNRKLAVDKPATTIRAECHGNIQWHYSLDRRISMREAARLQSFPDKFIFPQGIRATERQVGNAVPPVLAWHIAKAVREHLEP